MYFWLGGEYHGERRENRFCQPGRKEGGVEGLAVGEDRFDGIEELETL
jgi:hypothetical protein